jgi:hypothetical protein
MRDEQIHIFDRPRRHDGRLNKLACACIVCGVALMGYAAFFVGTMAVARVFGWSP